MLTICHILGQVLLHALFQFICTTIYDEDAIVNLVLTVKRHKASKD